MQIWAEKDIRLMKDVLQSSYPFINYFHGNVCGSGTCIFSKWAIEFVTTHSFGANGYPHRVDHGDWYCGKGFGMARITTQNGYCINVYILHLIARYVLDRNKDGYEGHRMAQVIELIEFINSTMHSVDAIFVAGDFNLEPETTGIKLLREVLGLRDAWLDCVLNS
ncbi:unnamed protein product [Protopolystoma xenopodis]|uniref:sphingomyelin phosphodiesterase n=1 Tax=Protopolystoma xenopodis TaxID=117903 RepID=A0A448WKE2_9PLAT|nr:unnamed protein product [Protopolystoma xenopodis]